MHENNQLFKPQFIFSSEEDMVSHFVLPFSLSVFLILTTKHGLAGEQKGKSFKKIMFIEPGQGLGYVVSLI